MRIEDILMTLRDERTPSVINMKEASLLNFYAKVP
jgi:hypothetical protein